MRFQTLITSACVAVVCVGSAVAQGQLLRGRVKNVSGVNNRFQVQCTGVELVSSTVDLRALSALNELEMRVAPAPSVGGLQTLELLSATPVNGMFDMGNLRIGDATSWTVFGTPGATAGVFIVPTALTAWVPLGDAGSWLLGGNAALLNAGAIRFDGRFRFDFAAPLVATIGISWTAQAVILDAGQIIVTNAECKTVE